MVNVKDSVVESLSLRVSSLLDIGTFAHALVAPASKVICVNGVKSELLIAVSPNDVIAVVTAT